MSERKRSERSEPLAGSHAGGKRKEGEIKAGTVTMQLLLVLMNTSFSTYSNSGDQIS